MRHRLAITGRHAAHDGVPANIVNRVVAVIANQPVRRGHGGMDRMMVDR